MTNEEALDYFEHDIDNIKDDIKMFGSDMNPNEYNTIINADFAAISALAKQVLEIPEQDEKTRWHCPFCGNWIAERQHYCDKCGQAINWEVLNVSRG